MVLVPHEKALMSPSMDQRRVRGKCNAWTFFNGEKLPREAAHAWYI